MSLNGLEKAIILSISYSNVFSTPLNSREVWLRLITQQEVQFEKVKQSLARLVKNNYLVKSGEYYCVGKKDLLDLKFKRTKYSQSKLVEAKRLINIAKLIPFVKAIVITGSLSVSNAKKNDDVDWLVITSKNSLWLTRPLIILIASFFGKRRERNGNHRDNSWCFNMFMTEESLAISNKKRSIYTAYEVCQAMFVYDSNGVEKQFLENNSWAKKYLKNFFDSRLIKVKGKRADYKINYLDNFITYLLNDLLFYIQYFYMKNRITREVVKKEVAFFHPRNTHGKIFNKWKQILRKDFIKSL
ncbi:MAG: hypothetical protein OEX81_04265 [Candidatus Pacebacteria bacterium]|nr:hypothetical protein [Candidatus Paceibacterota bacterium]